MAELIAHAQVALAVDVVLLTLVADQLKVRLVERDKAGFGDRWALPREFLRADEDLDGCARRLLRAQIGVVAEAVAQFGLYSSPTPNLDERVVSVAYVAGARDVERPQLTASDMRAEWRPVRPLPRNLVRGHAGVVRDALKYLEPIAETNPGPRLLPMLFALLPDKFTFARLHSAYEAILGRSVDKRNFRKVLLDARHVVETEAFERGSHRPARLYVRS